MRDDQYNVLIKTSQDISSFDVDDGMFKNNYFAPEKKLLIEAKIEAVRWIIFLKRESNPTVFVSRFPNYRGFLIKKE